jgi:hypothetical protein
LRRQEGGVGFDQEPIGRHQFGGIAQVLRFGVGQIAGKGDVKSQLQELRNPFRPFGEAMHDASGLPRLLAQNFEHASSGVAAVNDDRQVEFSCQLQVEFKSGDLNFGSTPFTKKVQPRFADGMKAASLSEGGDLIAFDIELFGFAPIIGVNANAGKNVVVLFSNLTALQRAFRVNADRHKGFYASGSGTLKAIGNRIFVGVPSEVAVSVEKAHGQLRQWRQIPVSP